MFDHHEVDDSKSGEADPSPEYLPTAQYADSGDDDGDSPVAAIQSALRLALRATESDVTCLVVRGRIAYWASRRRTSNTNNDDHGALIAENDATTERRRSYTLSLHDALPIVGRASCRERVVRSEERRVGKE